MHQVGDDGPVLVVGAGPTGLTAALELSRSGVPVRIVDATAAPSTTSRALAVQARTLELLEQRGLSAEMVRLGNPARAAALYGRGERLTAVDLQRIPSRYDFVLLLSQAEVERLLREQIARQGVRVEQGVEMIALGQEARPHRPSASAVRAVLRHSSGHLEEVPASYLISAEGAHSSVRHTLDLPFPGRSLPQDYALADLHLDSDLPDDELSVFLGTDGFLAVFPLGDHRFRLIATDRGRAPEGGDAPTPARLQATWDRVAGIPGRVRDVDWSSGFTINSRHLATLRTGRVFFGGDAAHVHSPAGGQGMNTGIQDMVNLCWKLAMVRHGQADPALLDTYQSERLPVISRLMRTTGTATDALGSPSTVVHELLTRALPLVLGLRVAQERGTRVLGQVGSSYRRSTLSSRAGRLGRLRAGDRVPDLALTAPPGVRAGAQPRPARLYQLLDLARLTLVVVEPRSGPAPAPAAWEEPLAAWRDLVRVHRVVLEDGQVPADRHLARSLDAAGGLLLVRPDAHLGAAAPLHDPRVLLGWLQRWFSPAAAGAPARSA